MLQIFVNGRAVGVLKQSQGNTHLFEYADGVPDKDCVSLLMLPSTAKSWPSKNLHPVFATSLPEGSVRKILSKKLLNPGHAYVKDIDLLAAVGRHLVGRLQAIPVSDAASNVFVNEVMPEKDLAFMLQNPGHEEVKQELFATFLAYTGVSGGFDKVLSRSPASVKDTSKTHTLMDANWIVKMDDPDHPALAANEYLGLLLCKQSGLPTPEVHLSDDLHRLLVARFDIRPDGSRYGFEDLCGLQGFAPDMKFTGSMERVCETVKNVVSHQHLTSSLQQLYHQHVLNMAIRNGDAHLKNFACLYDRPENVFLSPVYDVLTMSAYAPVSQKGDASDAPALTVGGVHRWTDAKSLDALAQRLSISPALQAKVAEGICDAMRDVMPQMIALSEVDDTMRPTIARIAHLWGFGIEIHSDALAHDLKECARKILAPPDLVYYDQPRGG